MPRNPLPARVPNRVRAGSAVRAKTRGMPGVSPPSSRLFRTPGPSDCVLVATPPSMFRQRAQAADSPKSNDANGAAPNREGRSSERLPAYHGDANELREESRDG